MGQNQHHPAPLPRWRRKKKLESDPSIAAIASSPGQAEDSSSSTSSEEEDDDLPRPGKVWQGNSGPSLSTLLAQHRAQSAAPANSAPAVPAAESNVESVDPSNLPAVWKACLKLLTAQGPGLHSLFAQGHLVAIEDDRAVLRFSPLHETFVLNWEKNGKKEVVRDAISRVINQKIGVKFEIDAEAPSAESAPSNGTPVTAPPTTTRS